MLVQIFAWDRHPAPGEPEQTSIDVEDIHQPEPPEPGSVLGD